MEQKDNLTNEKLKKRFESQFDLVNYAIRLAENMIRSGREPRVKIDNQNRAMVIIGEISNGKDQIDAIAEVVYAEPERVNGARSSDKPEAFKTLDRKKTRKIFAD